MQPTRFVLIAPKRRIVNFFINWEPWLKADKYQIAYLLLKVSSITVSNKQTEEISCIKLRSKVYQDLPLENSHPRNLFQTTISAS